MGTDQRFRHRYLDLVQLEQLVLPKRVCPQQRQQRVDDDEADPVDDQQRPGVGAAQPVSVRGRTEVEPGRHDVGEKRHHELERIDVEKNDEEQEQVEQKGDAVLDPVAAEVDEVEVPNHEQENEAQGEGREAPHRDDELIERRRHLERHDE